MRPTTIGELGTLRVHGLTAPCAFDGLIKRLCLRAYVQQQLLPTLGPGDVAIMDDLVSHQSTAVRHLIREGGARLWFLPPYSPNLNPIEQAFAKIKPWLRGAQRRTIGNI